MGCRFSSDIGVSSSVELPRDNVLRKLARRGDIASLVALGQQYGKATFLQEIMNRRYGTVFDVLAEAGNCDGFVTIYQTFFSEDTTHTQEIFLLLLVQSCQSRNFTVLAELIKRLPHLRIIIFQLLMALPNIFREQLKDDHPVPLNDRRNWWYRQVSYDKYTQFLRKFNRRSDNTTSTRGYCVPHQKERALDRAHNLAPYYCTLLESALQ